CRLALCFYHFVAVAFVVVDLAVDTVCSFFNEAAPAAVSTLSLHDALPISGRSAWRAGGARPGPERRAPRARDPRSARRARGGRADRKSTRLNSSHLGISYAVFCLKKKKKKKNRKNNKNRHKHEPT